MIQVRHFSVDFNADDVTADFGMETESKVEGERAFREVDNVAFRGIDEDFIRKEV